MTLYMVKVTTNLANSVSKIEILGPILCVLCTVPLKVLVFVEIHPRKTSSAKFLLLNQCHMPHCNIMTMRYDLKYF